MKSIINFFLKLGSYFLAGIFLLGFVMFLIGLPRRGRHGDMALVIIGGLIILPFAIGFLIYFLNEKKIDEREQHKRELEIIRLKQTGDKILVNLENIKFTTRSFRETKQRFRRFEGEISYKDFNINSVKIRVPYKGKSLSCGFEINMDPTNLKLHLAIKKKTFLYVDPNNYRKRYLDIDFLNETAAFP